MFEYILYYLLTCGFVMTYFIQVNEEILYDNYVKFEKERGTKPTRGSVERRLSTKKHKSEKKKNRKKPNLNNY